MRFVLNTLLAVLTLLMSFGAKALFSFADRGDAQTRSARRRRQRYFPSDNPPLIVSGKRSHSKPWRFWNVGSSFAAWIRAMSRWFRRVFDQLLKIGRSAP